MIEEHVITEDDDVLARQYVWGRYVDELVQQVEFEFLPPGKTSEAYYPLGNTVYSAVALARAGTNAPDDRFVEVYDMDVYGRTQVFSAPGVNGWFSDDDVLSTVGPVCKYLFTGREFDFETNLYYYRARYYSPDLGRFLSKDPLLYGAGSMNLYEYCMGNPGVNTDPTGEFLFVALAIAAAVVTVGYIAYKSIWGKPVKDPGLAKSLIPVWGSSQMAIHDFQTGHWIWGLFNTGMAVSDVFLLKSVLAATGKLLVKGGAKLGIKGAEEMSQRFMEQRLRSAPRALYYYFNSAKREAIEASGRIASRWGIFASERALPRAARAGLTMVRNANDFMRIPEESLQFFERAPAIGAVGLLRRYVTRVARTELGSVLLKGGFEADEVLARGVIRGGTVADRVAAAAHGLFVDYGFDLLVRTQSPFTERGVIMPYGLGDGTARAILQHLIGH